MREHVSGCHSYNPTYVDDYFFFGPSAALYNLLEHISEQVFKIEIEDVYSPAGGMMENIYPKILQLNVRINTLCISGDLKHELIGSMELFFK